MTRSRESHSPEARVGTQTTPPRHGVVPVDRLATLVEDGNVAGHVARTVDLMSSRLAERWTLGSLAGEVHLSRSQLVRVFHAAVGLSPMAYLRQMRVEHMAHLLRSTDLSISEAAWAVGLADASNASQCFRKHYGVSPTGYRHQRAALPVGMSDSDGRLDVWTRRAEDGDIVSLGPGVEGAYTPYIQRVDRRRAPLDDDGAEKLS